MALVRVTNISAGFRGIYPTGGLAVVDIDPGKHADIELSEADAEDAVATGWFTIGEPVDDEEDDAPLPHISRMNVEQLTALAKAEGVEFADGATKKQIREAIEAKREANA